MIVFVAIFALTISVGIYAYTKHNEPNSKVVDGSAIGIGGMCGDSEDNAVDNYHPMRSYEDEDNNFLDTMNEHATNFMNSITAGISSGSATNGNATNGNAASGNAASGNAASGNANGSANGNAKNINTTDELRVRLLVDDVHEAAVHEAVVHEAAVHEAAVHEAVVHEAAVHEGAVHEAAVHEAAVHEAAVHEGLNDEVHNVYDSTYGNYEV